jgi:hypothetical protein
MTNGAGDSASDVRVHELRLDRLLGRRVFARNAQSVGRIEEVRVERRGSGWIVTEVVIGAGGLLERLGVGVRLLFGPRTRGRVARWDQLDMTDPERPRLTCSREELHEA